MRYFHAVEEALNHHLIALHEGHPECRSQPVGLFHLAHAEAAAVGGRFHEAGHTQSALYLLLIVGFTAAEQQTVGYIHAKAAEIVVEHIFIERKSLNKHTAGRVRQMNEVEIALHHAVFAGLAVNGDIGVVEIDGGAGLHKRKVVFVDGHDVSVVKVDMPVGAFYIDDVDMIPLLVEEGIQPLRRAQGDIVFRRIATTDDGYISLDCFHNCHCNSFSIVQMYLGWCP